jgi:hypothetical protein
MGTNKEKTQLDSGSSLELYCSDPNSNRHFSIIDIEILDESVSGFQDKSVYGF